MPDTNEADITLKDVVRLLDRLHDDVKEVQDRVKVFESEFHEWKEDHVLTEDEGDDLDSVAQAAKGRSSTKPKSREPVSATTFGLTDYSDHDI